MNMKLNVVVSTLLAGVLYGVGCTPRADSEKASPGSGGAGGGGGGSTGTGTGGVDSAAGQGGDASTGGTDFVPPTEPELDFVPISLPLSGATDFDFVPGGKLEILVSTKAGALHHLQLTGESTTSIAHGQLPDVFTDQGCGVLALAFDPGFASNSFVYAGRCVDEVTTTLSRYDMSDLDSIGSSEAEIMTVTSEEPPPEDWHRWGSMGFEPDGETMWALLGDLFFREQAQDIASKPGSLLRFVPNRAVGGSGFEPAEGNPFSDSEEGDASVYAYGLRSPWRGTRDAKGRFWVGDVGEYTVEEINLITDAGENFGWPLHEGDCKSDCDDLVNAVTSWGRASDHPYVLEDPDSEPATKRAAWVGVVYEAPSVDRYYGLLDGLLLFGDFFMGWVRGLAVNDDGELRVDRLLGHLTEVTAVRIGPDGYIYLLTYGGTLYRAIQVVR
jgi:glucose/arabinose dehydrogenase